ncbi:MAG TPA: AmpG family muropeptide MFS transporter [Methylococcaceae bacterium]|nr:AmpG family muropeptide MFS transporter [Methylococcaceae bacterium]
MTSKEDGLWRSIFSARMGLALALGFYSGLPLLLTGSTLQAWLKESGLSLASLGALSLLGLPYTLKFLWAPLFDRYRWSGLGRRRGWLLASQLSLAAVCAALARVDPAAAPLAVAGLALLLAFFSASQDIVVDAWRRESLADHEQGFAASLYVNGYRLGMLLSGGGALILADYSGFRAVYVSAAVLMLSGALLTLAAAEPALSQRPPASLREAVLAPFGEFLARPRWGVILLFIVAYKLGDAVAGQMTTPFYLDLGFSKSEIGAVVKLFGLWATLIGALIGGTLLLRLRLESALWGFGILQALSTASFVALVHWGAWLPGLALVVTFENVSAGMGTAAFAAFMAMRTNRRFTATQYALLSSLMGVPRVVLAAPSGWLAEILGWPVFFFCCAALAVPGLLLIRRLPAHSGQGVLQ